VALTVEHLSTAATTTKTVTLDWYGADTIATRKPVGRIEVKPSEENWAGGGVGGFVFSPETGNATISQTFMVPHSGGIYVGTTSLVLTSGAIGMDKMTASASAPGANGAKLELVCGTNAGSLKLTVAGGTSATPVTIIDNIGSGATGC